MDISQQFSTLGFNDSEVQVYLGLAEVGKSTAGVLAKRLGMARTTVYSVLENLSQKGVVSLEEKRGATFYVVNKPEALLRVVERERGVLAKKEQAARELVEHIGPFFRNKFFSIPKFQFFDGKASVENMLYEQLPNWRATLSSADHTWWGYQDHTFVTMFEPWLRHYWAVRPDCEQVKLLSNNSPMEEKLRGKIERREIRQIPEEYDFSSSVWIVGDYIILIMTRQEPVYAFQFRDANFAANLRSVFRLLWTMTK